MKKILSLLLCMLFGLTILLAGCGGLSNVENDKKGIVYNGGSVALVNDYLFYANGFTKDYSSMADMNAYNDAAKYSNLSRAQLSNLNATKFKSSENVETVSGGDVTGFGKTYMFAYGDNVYYVTPNTHKTNENKQAFDYLSVFKVGFNGGNRHEIMTTKASFNSSTGKIVALEYKDVAYIMIYDGENLTTIDITNNDSVKVNLEDVTSVALPQEDATWNGQIYYTKDKENSDGMGGNEVYKIAVTGGEETKVTKDGENTKTIKFIGRIDNTSFYTISKEGETSAHTYTIEGESIGTEFFITASKEFYPKEISNIVKVDGGTSYFNQDGYVFTSSSIVLYKNTVTGGDPVVLIDNSTYANAKVIAAVGAYVYFSTTSGIYKVLTSTKEVTTIIDGMTITTDIAGYTFNEVDGEKVSLKDIYFYAQREYDEDAEEKDNEEETTDENVYLYQVSANGGDALLLGKTIN